MNSSVLRNKAGHETQEALDQFERLSVANRMMEDAPRGVFDYAHLKALHHHLFQDVYDGAGYDVDMDKVKEGWPDACIAGVHDEQPMPELIAGALVILED